MNTFTIKNGDYTAVINADKGANCISLRHERFPYAVLREPNYDKGIDNPFLYGSPFLFPVNRIENGTFTFNGINYVFPINEEKTNCHLHGNLHQAKFKVVEKTESSITCLYQENASANFPHAYNIFINYSILNDGLYQTVTIENLSDKPMPCMLGFHTTFNVCENCMVKAEIKEEIERNMENYLPTEKILPLDDIGNDLKNGTFTPKTLSKHYLSNGNKAEIFFPEENKSVVYEYDEKYLYRLIYGNTDFICLEPQTCIVNAPNLKGELKNSGFLAISPFSELKFCNKIYIKER